MKKEVHIRFLHHKLFYNEQNLTKALYYRDVLINEVIYLLNMSSLRKKMKIVGTLEGRLGKKYEGLGSQIKPIKSQQ